MFSIPGNVIDLTGNFLYRLFDEGKQMEGDIMDYLINLWKDKPETSEYSVVLTGLYLVPTSYRF